MKVYETHIGWIRSTDISYEERTINKNNRSMGFSEIGTTLRVTR